MTPDFRTAALIELTLRLVRNLAGAQFAGARMPSGAPTVIASILAGLTDQQFTAYRAVMAQHLATPTLAQNKVVTEIANLIEGHAELRALGYGHNALVKNLSRLCAARGRKR